MDRVLGAFGYQGDLEAVPPRQVRDAPFGRGQVMRAILDTLRSSEEPMNVRQIALAAFPDFCDPKEPAQLDNLCRRTAKALNRLKRDGAVRKHGDGFGNVVWALTAA